MADASAALDGARERIEEHRKGEMTVQVTDARGRPLSGREVVLHQEDSAFLFGANIFGLDPDDRSDRQRLYQERFCALLNYATLPFYWRHYEPEAGRTREARLRAMAQWCAEHGIRTKGHPLVWHQVHPAWADQQGTPALTLLEARVGHIVRTFAGLVDIWDVINESTVSERFDNAIGDWARREGATRIAAESLKWARAASQRAMLLVNDFNISPAYEAQIEGLLSGPHRPDAIGIQSHMHDGEWPLERAWQVCETYGRFGLPLHFTELTVLSGDRIPPNVPWSTYRQEHWPSTPEGEEKQAGYLEQFYTLLFSHPAVAAITCWDFADGGWMNAPGGLVSTDMSPKPVYERLLRLTRGDWRTNARLTTDRDGRARARAFYGSYLVTDSRTGRSVTCEHAGPGPVRAVLALD
jgi:endo-1,4-beta-xylanase